MSVLLLRYLPWIAGVLVVFGAGTYAGWAANPWHTRYTNLQAADAIERLHGEEAVRQELQSQLAQVKAVADNNANSMVKLANENAQTLADRDVTLTRVHRLEQLLAAQAARSAVSSNVPQAGSGSVPAGSSGERSADEVGELLIAARDECRRNATRLDTLSAEIEPQL